MLKKLSLFAVVILFVSMAAFANVLAHTPHIITPDWQLEEDGTPWRNWGVPVINERIFSTEQNSTVLHVSSGNTNAGAQRLDIPVEAGQTYELTFDYKVFRNYFRPILGVRTSNYDFEGKYMRLPTSSKDLGKWLSFYRKFTVPKTYTGDFRLVLVLTKSEVLLDNITFKKYEPALTDWKSDTDGDGQEDHTDTNIQVLDFTRACQLPPSLWSKANFGDVKTNHLMPVATRLGVEWNNYDAICAKNDLDKDWLFTVAPYGPGGNGSECRFDDPLPLTPNTSEANGCSFGFTYQPYVPGEPAPVTPPPTTPPTNPPTTPPTPPSTPPPASSVETYPNEQNVNFNLFPNFSAAQFGGAEIVISPTSSETIPQAIARANAGDKILLRAGTYSTNWWSIGKSLYVGAYNGEQVTVNISDPTNGRAIEIGTENVMIEGINFNITNHPGAIALYKGNVVIKGVNLNMGGSATFISGLVAFSPVNNLLVENTTINGADLGLSCNTGPCENWKISNVKITGRSGSTSSGADCFAIENGKNFFLKNVESTGCSADGIDVKGTQVLILNPYVHNVGRNGIKTWNGADIINALVYDTGADVSVFLGNMGLARLINSTVAFHSRDGQADMLSAAYDYHDTEMHVKIINSIFYNGSGFLIEMPNQNGTTRTLEMSNSIVYSMARGLGDMPTNAGPNNQINVDPKFVNPSKTGDFHLATDSPGINKGANTLYNFDRAGTVRPAGAFDVGAFER